MRKSRAYLIVVVAVLTLGQSGLASAGIWQEMKDTTWEDGRLRVEGQFWTGTRSGRRSRSGDLGVAGTVEKEFVLGQKLSLGLRAIPLFFMDEHHDDGEEVFGAGFGVSARYYVKEAKDGLFVEFFESVIGQSEKFRGNSGSINFMSEIGVGYEFDSNWHIAAKWRHISNAGFADSNAGINGIGIGFGFSF